MGEVIKLLPSLLEGILLGAIFFGGLWWTVSKGLSTKRSGLWFLSSLLFRTGVVLAGFYFLGRDHWERFVVCLLGFTIARVIILGLTRRPANPESPGAKEVCHAP